MEGEYVVELVYKHLYGLVVYTVFGDVVGCLISDLGAWVQWPGGAYVISIYSPVTCTWLFRSNARW